MLHPKSVTLSGTGTALGARVLANLRAGGFTGTVGTDDAPVENADLALVADDAADMPAALARHAAAGARGAIVLSVTPNLAQIARDAGIRVLGPHSFGLVIPSLGLNASPFTTIPAKGRMALIGQSASIARTVIDWAVPNSIGFSHLISIGGNSDIGFGLVIDHVCRDPGTTAILLEVDRLRDPKVFFTAARAAARLRPVVAIAPGLRLRDEMGGAWEAMEAALSRAGVLLTGSIGEFLAAAETLARVKPARNENLAIVTNSVSLGRLAADEALRCGIKLAKLSAETKQVLALSLDAEPRHGLIFTGKDAPTHLADIAALLSPVPEVGGILVIHAPTGGDDSAAIEALIACAKTIKIPLLIAAMGEEHGLRHRHSLSQARIACFDSPEHAIAGFRHLLQNRRNRAAARELPDSEVLSISPNSASVSLRIEAARALGHDVLVQDDALAIVNAYHVPVIQSRHARTPDEAAEAATALGFPAVVKLFHPDMPATRLEGSVALDLPNATAVREAAHIIQARMENHNLPWAGAEFVVQTQAPRGTSLRIHVADHPLMGPVIRFGTGGGDREDLAGLTPGLPPLNLPLAHALIRRSPVMAQLTAHRGQPAADEDAIAKTLVRISQLIVDTPDILRLDLDPIFANENGVVAASARITLRGPGNTRPPMIISPYPAELVRQYAVKGQSFTLRPIRPEDADAHASMLSRFSAEDMRYRFFSPMRQLPPEQIARLTDVDYSREMAFVAVRDATGETMGVARLVRDDTDGLSAEFAVAVEPAGKGLGIGSGLMHAIIDWGRAQGVKEIAGQILADNAPMLAFIRRLGFKIERIPDEPDVVEATLLT
jgi:acetyltransferase